MPACPNSVDGGGWGPEVGRGWMQSVRGPQAEGYMPGPRASLILHVPAVSKLGPVNTWERLAIRKYLVFGTALMVEATSTVPKSLMLLQA